MPQDPNRAPDRPAEQAIVQEAPGAFLNSTIVALVGLPLYFTADWKVWPWARWPLFFLTVLAVLACGINPVMRAVNRLVYRLHGRKGRPGKPAVLDHEMVFSKTPADSASWTDPEFMKAFEGDVVSMGYEDRSSDQPAPYTALRFRKRRDGHIECLIAVEGWGYPEFHRISLPPAIAALLYGTRHTSEEAAASSASIRPASR